MVARRAGRDGWDRVVPALSEDGLLLAEASHRVANEVSAAIAAMRLIRSGRGRVRPGMLDEAIARLEGFAEVVSALRIPVDAPYDLRRGIEALCDALCAGRQEAGRSTLSLDLVDTMVEGTTGRRIMMIAAELIHNAIRYALEHRSGQLAVVLRRDEYEVRLAVIDDGPGIVAGAEPSGSGMGRHIVAELVRRGGGELCYESGPRGTVVRIVMPRHVDAGAEETDR